MVAREQHEREGSINAAERVADRVFQALLFRLRDEVDHDLGIAGRLENGALLLQLGANGVRVDQVAIVRESDLPLVALDHDGLRVEQRGVTRGGITRVANGQQARQPS